MENHKNHPSKARPVKCCGHQPPMDVKSEGTAHAIEILCEKCYTHLKVAGTGAVCKVIQLACKAWQQKLTSKK